MVKITKNYINLIFLISVLVVNYNCNRSKKLKSPDIKINEYDHKNEQSKQKKLNNEIYPIDLTIKLGETLSSILLPYKGIKYPDVIQIANNPEFSNDLNNIQTGQKYQIILDKNDSTIVSYKHFFSQDNIIEVLFQDDISIHKIKISNSKNVIEKINTSINEPVNIKNIDYGDIEISKSLLIGKTNFGKNSAYIKFDNKYHSKSTMYLERETASAFIRMHEAAKQDGINLIVVSGARNYYSQKSIWERKFNSNRQAGYSPVENATKILKYSSMPTTSRHHWGTDIDINSLEPTYFESGIGKKEYEWLSKNAIEFGFCQVYTDFDIDDRTTGYQNEAWHWSYIPKAKIYLKEYNDKISYEDINGFLGSDLAEELNMIDDYVNGISSNCF